MPDPATDPAVRAFLEGTSTSLPDLLGAHEQEVDGVAGTRFAVWAPRAAAVAVITDANGWDAGAGAMTRRGDGSGIWQAWVPGAAHGHAYRYLVTAPDGTAVEHADPLARHAETPPANASKIWTLDHVWQDDEWLADRPAKLSLDAPMAVYEVHLGSWVRGEDGRRHLTYREVAEPLVEHVRRLGFTHVEFLPLAEHPFYGSWGYQGTGYFAPTSRYGAPEDLMWLVDRLHQAGIGVVLDWVPAHFPDDWWGLASFDGQPLYEHSDPQRGRHPDWNSAMFDYGRPEVRAFLISSALWWIRTYHVDALRVDAVASMLYLDHSRGEGEWTPNVHGGNEHLEAVAFIRQLTDTVHREAPGVQLIAEESTDWPGVTRPVADGGLGFDRKWDMGWATDLLRYLGVDPIHRSGIQQVLTFRTVYQHDERYTLPLSHDESTSATGSVLQRMHGDERAALANLRALLGLACFSVGNPLVFMGVEFGQRRPWDPEGQLDWHLLDDPGHAGVQRWLAAALRAYTRLPALHAGDGDAAGFEWVDGSDADHSVISFLRRAPGRDLPPVLVVAHLTPVPRPEYGIGVPEAGDWVTVASSDLAEYGGSGIDPAGPAGRKASIPEPAHGHLQQLRLFLPPLSVVALTPAR